MASNGTVPKISIIAEDGNSESETEGTTIDAHTDIEDLDPVPIPTVRNKKKILTAPPRRYEELTDVEDMEASDNELEAELIKHAEPLSVDELMEVDEISYDEGYKLEFSSEQPTTSNSRQTTRTGATSLHTDPEELYQGLTDLEDFVATDDERESDDNYPDTDLLSEIIQGTGATNISDTVKQFLKYTPSPAVTPVDGMSDAECEKNSKLLFLGTAKVQRLSPMTLSPQLSDLTDVEVLHSDDDEEIEVKKPRHRRPKTKRHQASKEIRLGVTDTEDLEVSDADDRKLVLKGYTLAKEKPRHPKRRVTSKSSKKSNLCIDLTDDGPLTDVEELNMKTPGDEDKDIDEVVAVSVRRGKGSITTELFRKSRPEEDQNETDEEFDVNMAREDYRIPDDAEFEVKFKSLNKAQDLPKTVPRLSKVKKGLVVDEEEMGALTDIEEMGSSDDEIQRGREVIPVVILDAGEDTDTESLDGQPPEAIQLNMVPGELITEPVRQLVHVKEREDNFPVITVTPLEDDEELEREVQDYPGTDVEDMDNMSDQEDVAEIEGSADMYMPEQETISYSDGVKERVESVANYDTDQEDINLDPVVKKRTNRNYLNAEVPSTSKTDVEDMVASDDELEVPSRVEPSITPDMLRQMSGDVVVTKEKNTALRREKRRGGDSDVPTDTDEVATSTDDEPVYARADTATPMQYIEEQNDAASTEVYAERMKHLDLNATDEVLYIKGGGYSGEADLDEIGMFSYCPSKILIGSGMSVVMSLITCNYDTLDEIPTSTSVQPRYIDSAPVELFSLAISERGLDFSTQITVYTVPTCEYFLTMLYVEDPHIWVLESPRFYISNLDFGQVQNLPLFNFQPEQKKTRSKSITCDLKKHEIICNRCRSGSVSKLVSKYESMPREHLTSSPEICNDTENDTYEAKVLNVKTVFNINSSPKDSKRNESCSSDGSNASEHSNEIYEKNSDVYNGNRYRCRSVSLLVSKYESLPSDTEEISKSNLTLNVYDDNSVNFYLNNSDGPNCKENTNLLKIYSPSDDLTFCSGFRSRSVSNLVSLYESLPLETETWIQEANKHREEYQHNINNDTGFLITKSPDEDINGSKLQFDAFKRSSSGLQSPYENLSSHTRYRSGSVSQLVSNYESIPNMCEEENGEKKFNIGDCLDSKHKKGGNVIIIHDVSSDEEFHLVDISQKSVIRKVISPMNNEPKSLPLIDIPRMSPPEICIQNAEIPTLKPRFISHRKQSSLSVLEDFKKLGLETPLARIGIAERVRHFEELSRTTTPSLLKCISGSREWSKPDDGYIIGDKNDQRNVHSSQIATTEDIERGLKSDSHVTAVSSHREPTDVNQLCPLSLSEHVHQTYISKQKETPIGQPELYLKSSNTVDTDANPKTSSETLISRTGSYTQIDKILDRMFIEIEKQELEMSGVETETDYKSAGYFKQPAYLQYSLTDVNQVSPMNVECKDEPCISASDDHIYESIDGPVEHACNEIWYEGVYRDLSTVHEEEEVSDLFVSRVTQSGSEVSSGNFGRHFGEAYSLPYDMHSGGDNASCKSSLSYTDKGGEIDRPHYCEYIGPQYYTKTPTGSRSQSLVDMSGLEPMDQRKFASSVDVSGWVRFGANWGSLQRYPTSSVRDFTSRRTSCNSQYNPFTDYGDEHVNLFANRPYYPTRRDTFSPDHVFPSAYCDWLTAPEDSQSGGAISTPARIDSAPAAGSVVLDDVDTSREKGELDSASKDAADTASPLTDHDSSPRDKRARDGKGKGFFSSLRSLMGRSSDYSDSESDRSDAQRKEKGTPKKKKKDKAIKSSPTKTKPRCPSPKDLNQPEITISAPPPDIESTLITDLDVEPMFIDDVNGKIPGAVHEIIDSHDKDRKHPSEKAIVPIISPSQTEVEPKAEKNVMPDFTTMTPEEFKKMQNITTDLIQNEINFQGWPDDFHVASKSTDILERPTEEHSDVEDSANEKSESDEPKKRKKKGFLKIFSRDKSEERDKIFEEPVEEEKATKNEKLPKKEDDNRKSVGFFGLFNKKSKRDSVSPDGLAQEIVYGEPIDSECADMFQKEMMDSSHFLMKEVENYHDVRPPKQEKEPETLQLTKKVKKGVKENLKETEVVTGQIDSQTREHHPIEKDKHTSASLVEKTSILAHQITTERDAVDDKPKESKVGEEPLLVELTETFKETLITTATDEHNKTKPNEQKLQQNGNKFVDTSKVAVEDVKSSVKDKTDELQVKVSESIETGPTKVKSKSKQIKDDGVSTVDSGVTKSKGLFSGLKDSIASAVGSGAKKSKKVSKEAKENVTVLVKDNNEILVDVQDDIKTSVKETKDDALTSSEATKHDIDSLVNLGVSVEKSIEEAQAKVSDIKEEVKSATEDISGEIRKDLVRVDEKTSEKIDDISGLGNTVLPDAYSAATDELLENAQDKFDSSQSTNANVTNIFTKKIDEDLDMVKHVVDDEKQHLSNEAQHKINSIQNETEEHTDRIIKSADKSLDDSKKDTEELLLKLKDDAIITSTDVKVSVEETIIKIADEARDVKDNVLDSAEHKSDKVKQKSKGLFSGIKDSIASAVGSGNKKAKKTVSIVETKTKEVKDEISSESDSTKLKEESVKTDALIKSEEVTHDEKLSFKPDKKVIIGEAIKIDEESTKMVDDVNKRMEETQKVAEETVDAVIKQAKELTASEQPTMEPRQIKNTVHFSIDTPGSLQKEVNIVSITSTESLKLVEIIDTPLPKLKSNEEIKVEMVEVQLEKDIVKPKDVSFSVEPSASSPSAAKHPVSEETTSSVESSPHKSKGLFSGIKDSIASAVGSGAKKTKKSAKSVDVKSKAVKDDGSALAEIAKEKSQPLKENASLESGIDATKEKLKAFEDETVDLVKSSEPVLDSFVIKKDGTKEGIETTFDGAKAIKKVTSDLKDDTHKIDDNIVVSAQETKEQFKSKKDDTQGKIDAEVISAKQSLDTVQQFTSDVRTDAVQIRDTVFDTISDTASDIPLQASSEFQFLKDKTSDLTGQVQTVQSHALEDGKSAIQIGVEETKEKAVDITSNITETGEKVEDSIKVCIKDTKDGVSKVADDLKSEVCTKTTEMKVEIDSNVESVSNKTKEVTDNTVQALDAGVTKSKGFFSGMKDSIVSAVGAGGKKTKKAIHSAENEVKDAVDDATVVLTKSETAAKDKIGYSVEEIQTTIEHSQKATADSISGVEEKSEDAVNKEVKDVEIAICTGLAKIDEAILEVKHYLSPKTTETETEIKGSVDLKSLGARPTDILTSTEEPVFEKCSLKVDMPKSDQIKSVADQINEAENAINVHVDNTNIAIKETSDSIATTVDRSKEKSHELKDKASDFTTDVSSAVSSGIDTVKSAAESAETSVTSGVDQTKGTAKEMKEDISESMSSTVAKSKGFFGGLKDSLSLKKSKKGAKVKAIDVKDAGQKAFDSGKEISKEPAHDVESGVSSAINSALSSTRDTSDKIAENATDLKVDAQSTVDSAKQTIGEALDETAAGISLIGESLMEKTDNAKQAVGDKSHELKKDVKGTIESTKSSLDKTASSTMGTFETKIDGIKQDVLSATDASTDKISHVKDDIAASIESTVDSCKQKFENAEDASKIARVDLQNTTGHLVDATKEKIQSSVDASSQKVKEMKDGAECAVESSANKVIDATKSMAKDAKDSIECTLDASVCKIKDTNKKVDEHISEVSQDAKSNVDGIKDATKMKVEVVREKSGQIGDEMESIFEKCITKLETDKGTAGEKLDKVAVDSNTLAHDELGSIKNTFSEMKESVSSKIEGVEGNIVTAASDKKSEFDDVQSGVSSFLYDAKESSKKVIQESEDVVKSKIEATKTAAQDCKEKTNANIGSFINASETKITGMKDAVDCGLEDLKTKATNLKTGMETETKSIIGASQSKMNEIKSDAVSLIETAGTKTKEVKTDFVEKLDTVAMKSKEGLVNLEGKSKDTFSSVKDHLESTSKSIVDSIQSKTDETKTGVSADVKKLKDGAAATAEKNIEKLSVLTHDIDEKLNITKDATRAKLDDVKDTSSKIVDAILEKSAETKTKTFNILEDASSKLQTTTEATKDATKDLSGKLTSTFSNVKDEAKSFASSVGSKGVEVKAGTEETLKDSDCAKKEIVSSLASTLKKETKEVQLTSADMLAFIQGEMEHTATYFDKKPETKSDYSSKEILSDKKEHESKKGLFSFLGSIADPVKSEAAALVTSVSDSVKDEGEKVKTLGKVTQDGTEKVIADVKSKSAEVKESTIVKSKEIVDEVQNNAKEKIMKANNEINAAMGSVKEFSKESLETSKNTVENATDQITDDLKSSKDAIAKSMESTKSTSEKSFEIAKDKTAVAIESAETKTKQGFDIAKDKTMKVVESVKDKTEEAIDKTKEFIEPAKEKTENTIKHTKETVQALQSTSKDALKKSKDNAEISIVSAKDTIKNSFESANKESHESLKAAKSGIEDTTDDFSEGIDNSLEKSKGFFGGLKESLSSVIDSGVTKSRKSRKKKSKDTSSPKVESPSLESPTESSKSMHDKKFEEIDKSIVDAKAFVAEAETKAMEKTNVLKDKTKEIKDDLLTGAQSSVAYVEATAEKAQKNAEESTSAVTEFAKVNKDYLKSAVQKEPESYDDKIDELLKNLDKNITIPESKREKPKGNAIDVDAMFDTQFKINLPTTEVKTDVSTTEPAETKYPCYVTTPTMQRRGIGGSQRCTKGERPVLMDISHMPADASSEEDEYIVTEPSDDFLFCKPRMCSSPEIILGDFNAKRDSLVDAKSRDKVGAGKSTAAVETGDLLGNMCEHLQKNVNPFLEDLSKNTQNIDTIQGGITGDLPKELPKIVEHQVSTEFGESTGIISSKRRPMFRIESEEDESFDLGDKGACASDVETIEKKLSSLSEALDILEKQELKSFDPVIEDDQPEHKLHRVERKFERIASETMDKEVMEAKQQNVTSPEVEATREAEFQKMVSQLSREEVSDSQDIYSNLFEDTTFTTSDDWDSKTPDSQPDLLDLPAAYSVGEVVYMGPVTLNKDHMVNTAGVEVDVIPVRRSPSPLASRGRARSKRRGKLSRKPVGVIEPGSILGAVLRLGSGDLQIGSANPRGIKDDALDALVVSEGCASARCASPSVCSTPERTRSLSAGVLVNAVREWMLRSSAFGSTSSLSDGSLSLSDSVEILLVPDVRVDDLRNERIEFLWSEENNLLLPIEGSEATDANESTVSSATGAVAVAGAGSFSPTSSLRRERCTIDDSPLGESCDPKMANLTAEASATNAGVTPEPSAVPKPKPRTAKSPDTKPLTAMTDTLTSVEEDETVTSDVVESYTDRKKFWENVAQQTPTVEVAPVKKRMSLYEETISKEKDLIKTKRSSVHEVAVTPPVPKPRSTLTPTPSELNSSQEEPEEPEKIVSEYMSSYKDPTSVSPKPLGQSDSIDSEKEYIQKYGDMQAYENVGYESDPVEELEPTEPGKTPVEVMRGKRRQMSVSQPPVAAARKTIFERSVSLPTDELPDILDRGVKAKKRFFEQQIRNELVTDQLMTTEEEQDPEYKTLPPVDTKQDHIKETVKVESKICAETIETIQESEQLSDFAQKSTTNLEKTVTKIDVSPNELVECTETTTSSTIHHEERFASTTEHTLFKDNFSSKYESGVGVLDLIDPVKEDDKKSSPISTSSSQDTKTEEDITQDTPTSTKDLIKSFQVMQEEVPIVYGLTTGEKCEDKLIKQLIEFVEPFEEEVTSSKVESVLDSSLKTHHTKISSEHMISEKKESTESEPSISSERSVELGSVDDLPEHISDMMHHKSDSISKPGDSLEVHVDKSELEDSEKLADTDTEAKSFESERMFDGIDEKDEMRTEEFKLPSPINRPQEHVPDTVWEVVESQPALCLEEQVQELTPGRPAIHEPDEELSGSVRDESDLGSEIHQDHSESIDSERHKSESQNDVEKIILESLYQQHIHPDEAKKIAAELLDDIEAEIERRNTSTSEDLEDLDLPTADVAQNQISEYIRKLAEYKGLDAKEMQLVESVLARKQREFNKLSRRDTQTSSMEITDEDLRYSGECDLSPLGSHENILEEQIGHLESESCFTKIKDTVHHEKHTERSQETSTREIHFSTDDEKKSPDESDLSKSELSAKIDSMKTEETVTSSKFDRGSTDTGDLSEEFQESVHKVTSADKISADLKDVEVFDDSITTITVKAEAAQDDSFETAQKTIITKLESDVSKTEKVVKDDVEAICASASEGLQSEKFHKEAIEGGSKSLFEKIDTTDDLKETSDKHVESTEEVTIAADGSESKYQEFRETVEKKSITSSHVVSEKREESVTSKVIDGTFTIDNEMLSGDGLEDLLSFKGTAPILEEHKHTSSEESKSSQDEFRSPDDNLSSTSANKDDSDSSKCLDRGVILRKTIYREYDTSSSSGNLRADRKSGADFETYSSSGESHYHSFEESARSRPCSSDVEGLVVGSSEYESALTSQEASSRSHVTTYHTAVSSLSSRESMRSLDSESSGNMASVEVSEASETLVPSTFDLEGDILDESVNQLLVDDFSGLETNVEKPSTALTAKTADKCSFDTDSEVQGESIDLSEEDAGVEKVVEEVMFKMKRSQEMTFQPEPKAVIPDSPQSEHTLEMDERFGTSLEDGSVLSVSLSSTSDASHARTVVETSRRGSGDDEFGRLGSSEQFSLDDLESLPRSLDQLDNLDSIARTLGFHDGRQASSLPAGIMTDSSTSTIVGQSESLNSVVMTTSMVVENGSQSASTQIISHAETASSTIKSEDLSEYKTDDSSHGVEPKKTESHETVEPRRVRGHRRNESTTLVGFTVPPDVLKTVERSAENEKLLSYTMTLKEERSDELKDVDEAEKSVDTSYIDSKSSVEAESDLDIRFDLDVEEKLEPELAKLICDASSDIGEPIDRPITPEPREEYEIRFEEEVKEKKQSSFEDAEAEPVFSMVAHVSPAHRAKGDICPIIEDEDAEKYELEARQLDIDRRQQMIQEHSPGSIPDIMVTQHMTPLKDAAFHYPDLELEEIEELGVSPQTPASTSSRSSVETDQGREYVLEEAGIPEEPEIEIKETPVTPVQQPVVEDKAPYSAAPPEEPHSAADSPNSDSFEMLEKPDIIDDFVVIEEVAREAGEHDTEGIAMKIKQTKYVKRHDDEVEEYLVKSAPTVLTKMTDLKYYPDGHAPDELGPFDFEDSPPQVTKRSTGVRTGDVSSSTSCSDYDRELEASKKWIEMQFQGEQGATAPAGYGYEMEFERGPLEDIKEEEPADFDSSRIGSLDSHKQSGGSLGSVKDSFSSTPEYDVLAGRKFFTRSGEHDDVSMSSLQEFEQLERVISLENRRHHQGSQDSSSNGSFTRRYHVSRSGQGDDVSMSSLKEFEGLETACIEAHRIEVKAKEEEEILAQIEESQENPPSESDISKATCSTDKDGAQKSEEEDYEKRMFEIEEIIRQAQSNVEKFIDMKDLCEKTESMGRGDSLEEVAKVPDLELDAPVQRSSEPVVKWEEDPMTTSVDSLDIKASRHSSADSLDAKTAQGDVMTASTDSIEFHGLPKSGDNIMTDSIEIPDPDHSCMVASDSLELASVTNPNAVLSDSIDEDGSRIGEVFHDGSSSSGRADDFGSERDDLIDQHDDARHDYLLGSTDSLDPTSSTATHATYQYETDSVLSGSFTSGGSNTMVSSTDNLDPAYQTQTVDIATAVRKVWFDENSFPGGSGHITAEILDDGSKPFVTEVIEPCEDDPEYSHTVHRRVELPPEVRKITFRGADAEDQLRRYIEDFGEGEDIQETEEVDADGNVHVKRVVQKRFIVKTDTGGSDKPVSGSQLDSYIREMTQTQTDPTDIELTRQTHTDSDGTKIIYGQTFATPYHGEESSLKDLLSSIASDVAGSSVQSERPLTSHLDYQQAGNWQHNMPTDQIRTNDAFTTSGIVKEKDDSSTEKVDPKSTSQESTQPREVADQHQLSSEMKDLLAEMEKQAKH